MDIYNGLASKVEYAEWSREEKLWRSSSGGLRILKVGTTLVSRVIFRGLEFEDGAHHCRLKIYKALRGLSSLLRSEKRWLLGDEEEEGDLVVAISSLNPLCFSLCID
ncbi:hypothetical protein V6N12_062538 [Hibiscus sabdariffa]|uniref:Uncharacterized protein n=1 Tax=Hibiscus sabdariffa TaxID=183260 RepID=A0ABR2F953_9ROSI